jgi:riboflavin-specific deaminase-like protein
MKRPVVEANFAMTVDGKISTRAYAPTGFTSPRDKRRLLEIRARGDALLVGRRTLETDNMSMGLPARDLQEQRLREGRPAEPLRVIFTNRGHLRRDSKVFRSRGAPIVVFTTAAMPRATRAWLERVADVRLMGRAGRAVDLRKAMGALREDYNVRTAVCEGGPSLLRALLARHLLDRIFVTFAPLIFGGAAAPTLLGPAADSPLGRSVRLRLENFAAADGEGYATYGVGPSR